MSIWAQIKARSTEVDAITDRLYQLQQDTNTTECNGNFQRLVAYRILEAGKSPEAITLAELSTITAAANAEYSREMQAVRRLTHGY